MPTYTNAIRSNPAGGAVAGALQAIAMGGPTDWLGNASLGREFQTGVTEDLTDGFPAPPSLRFEWWGFFRYRWGVAVGTNSVTIYAKQPLNESPRPSVVLKKNTAVGLVADTAFVAAAGVGWVAIPVSFVATGAGIVVVQLWNNLNTTFSAPCLFSGPQFALWANGVPLLDNSQSGGSGPVTTGGKFRISAKQERSRQP